MRPGHPPSGNDAGQLRARAEERVRAREEAASLRTENEADALRLLHELQVHQVELELQNAELQRTRDEVEAALERYTDLYDFAPVGYFTLARDGGIYSANLAGADLLGVPRARLLGRRFGTFLPLTERPGFDVFLTRTLADTQRESCEVTLEPAGGGRRVVRVEATASPSGKECRAAVLDVTALRAAEAEVRRVNDGLERTVAERTAELGAANAELEAFVQSVSHDLRAPVRTISGFSRILAEDFGKQLPPVAADHLRRIHAGAHRMGALIDDLLRLSRIGKVELEITTVDLAGPCREILDELAAGSPDRRVETVVAASIPVRGDARFLRVMLRNLLENAWKFTAAEPAARIEVSSRLGADGQRETDFSDNGAGFDMSLAGKLFVPFQRLHTAEEFAGTGIGLAIVDRIVRRHGGSIRAESVEGAGAVFSVRLPAPREGAP
ncbi:MAG: PAS domain-containing protein [Holophagales bacterium]|nr:PAS domain-containing protein [Holophagales bacterium]